MARLLANSAQAGRSLACSPALIESPPQCARAFSGSSYTHRSILGGPVSNKKGKKLALGTRAKPSYVHGMRCVHVAWGNWQRSASWRARNVKADTQRPRDLREIHKKNERFAPSITHAGHLVCSYHLCQGNLRLKHTAVCDGAVVRYGRAAEQ